MADQKPKMPARVHPDDQGRIEGLRALGTLIQGSPPLKAPLSYYTPILIQCTLPHSDPKTPSYAKTNGDFSLIGSCPCSLRLNTRSLPGDRHRSKKASTIGPTWRHSGPLHRDDALDAGRADTRRLLRPPSLAPSHHHGVLTDPLAGATAARERVAPLSRSRRDRSGPRPSPASEAATAWPSPCHGWVPAAAEADVRWREAGSN